LTASVRLADRPGDVGEVIALHGRVYAQEYGLDVTMETHVASGLAEWLRGSRDLPGRLWVADGDVRIAGCIGVTGLSSETARLRWFVVDPAHRGQGLGSALLAELMGFVRASGYRRVELETFSELTGAARLYQAAGFERTGAERREFCGREVDIEWYALEL
jgi:ribosomal protein S18 acetylase RimI-like enzyme